MIFTLVTPQIYGNTKVPWYLNVEVRDDKFHFFYLFKQPQYLYGVLIYVINHRRRLYYSKKKYCIIKQLITYNIKFVRHGDGIISG
jgi:hypothetical protein